MTLQKNISCHLRKWGKYVDVPGQVQTLRRTLEDWFKINA
jgi:hypothetical protein